MDAKIKNTHTYNIHACAYIERDFYADFSHVHVCALYTRVYSRRTGCFAFKESGQ